MFKKAETMDDVKKRLSNMKLEDKIDLLSDIDVDWDGFFASVVFQKMQNDPAIAEKINSKLNSSPDTKEESKENANNIGLKEEDIDKEKESAKQELENMFDSDMDKDNIKEEEEGNDNDEDVKESKSDKDKKEKVIRFKLKKDEFEGNKLTDKKSYNSILNHDSDEFSVNRDYAVNEGNSTYDPPSTNDYIIDDEDNELNPGNPKGKKNWKYDKKD